MEKLSKKQGEKLPHDNVPSLMRWQIKGAAYWERVEDANNCEPSFKILINVMTPFELYMSQVDFTL